MPSNASWTSRSIAKYIGGGRSDNCLNPRAPDGFDSNALCPTWLADLFRFLVALAAQMAANTFMLAYFLHHGLSVWGAQITATVILTFANYLA